MLPIDAIKYHSRVIVLILALIIPTLIAACGGGGQPGDATTPALGLEPSSVIIGAGTTQRFTASGGQSPYSYSVASGNGAIDATGLFTAPASPSSASVRVTDAGGASATASVLINAALAMNAASITMTASSGQSFRFSGTGGSGAGYQYTLLSGSGISTLPKGPTGEGPQQGESSTISAGGFYNVGNSTGRVTVQVRDSQGTTASSTVEALRVRTNGLVNSIVRSASSLYVGGSFSAVNPYLTSRMAVLDPTSGKPQLQCDLNVGFDAPVRKLLLVNSALYVGGDFSSYKGQPAHGLAKLDPITCALDTTFTQSVGFAGTSSSTIDHLVGPFQAFGATSVTTMAASGSSLVVAGSFTSYRGQPAQNLAKLDLQTGALDQTFTADTGADGPLWAVAVSGDSVYVAGVLSHYRGTAVTHWGPVKLDFNSGALDPRFSSPTGSLNPVTALLYYGSSLYVAGSVQLSIPPYAEAMVLKVDGATGAQDTTFEAVLPPPGQSGPQQTIMCMVGSGQALYVSGQLTTTAGQKNLLKLDASTGQVDSSFNQAPSLDSPVYSVASSGSSVYLVGGFHAPGSQSSLGILKLDATTGTADSAFGLNPGFGGTPLTVTADDKAVYVGGAISGYGGSAAANIAKFDVTSGVADGAFDTTAGTDEAVNKILISGSSMYLGGLFFHYSGVAAGFVAKADANTGAPDTTFMQGGFTLIPHGANFGSFSGGINALALSGTSLYVGGRFTHYRGQPAADLAKIDVTSGSLDLTFMQGDGLSPPLPNSQPFPDVTALVATQNALFVGGNFSEYRGVAVSPLLKLDPATGAMDTAFAPPISVPFMSSPTNMALVVSGNSVYVGATTATLAGGVFSTGVCKLDATSGAVNPVFTQAMTLNPRGTTPGTFAFVSDMTLAGSSVYVAGDFELGSSPGGSNLIKVDAATGAMDATFSQAGGPDGPVNSLLLEGDSLYIGGSFSTYREKPASFSAALDPATGANRDVAAF